MEKSLITEIFNYTFLLVTSLPSVRFRLKCLLDQKEKDDTGTELGLTSRPQLYLYHLYVQCLTTDLITFQSTILGHNGWNGCSSSQCTFGICEFPNSVCQSALPKLLPSWPLVHTLGLPACSGAFSSWGQALGPLTVSAITCDMCSTATHSHMHCIWPACWSRKWFKMRNEQLHPHSLYFPYVTTAHRCLPSFLQLGDRTFCTFC